MSAYDREIEKEIAKRDARIKRNGKRAFQLLAAKEKLEKQLAEVQEQLAELRDEIMRNDPLIKEGELDWMLEPGIYKWPGVSFRWPPEPS